MLLRLKENGTEETIQIGSQLPAILIAGEDTKLTQAILQKLEDSLLIQFDCQSLKITRTKELEDVISQMQQRINRYRNYGYLDDTKAVVIKDAEALAETTNGLIYLDYLFERSQASKMMIIVRSTVSHLTSLLINLSERCSVRLVGMLDNQRDFVQLAQPDGKCGLPSNQDSSFVIRQEGIPPRLLSLDLGESKVGDSK